MYKFHNWRMLHPTSDAGGGSVDSTGASAQTSEDNAGEDGDGDGDPADEGEQAKTVSMTQEEFDAKFDQAYARGFRKGSKDARKGDAPSDKPGDDDAANSADATAQAKAEAQALVTAANQKLVSATIVAEGADMGISAKGLKVAAKVIDMDDCLDAKGNVDEDAIRDELDTFLKDYPEFKRQDGKKPGFQQFEGNPKGSGPKMSKEEIMKIKDPAKRRKAIADNITLFQ